ncbi:hypothetical protein KUCAC02_015227 [Chaenocephalus aceratus]|uniref:Uncharacterized protein n=1 Tax=Chaenocephalus aceratus TaxID=36190 RepID=A0ACB9XY53_CHAAC|nr:hypothetical protein KUCAC02_015227 [Chaenocephalus aceratus]
MAQVSIETSGKRLEAQPLVHVLDAKGSNMSGAHQDGEMMADSLHVNTTAALGLHDQEMDSALSEFKVFNIVIIALALCILTLTGLYCITVCYNRTRMVLQKSRTQAMGWVSLISHSSPPFLPCLSSSAPITSRQILWYSFTQSRCEQKRARHTMNRLK